MAEVALFLTVRTLPGQREALKALWEKHLKDRAAANDQQSHYIFAFDADDADLVRICEVYETRAAFEANAGTEWFATYMAVATPLLDGRPDFHMTVPQWVK